MTPLLLALPGDALAHRFAETLHAEMGQMELRSFPDGETYVRIDSPVAGREVVIVCSLHQPDSKVMPLLLLAATARDLGAGRVGLVAPYLAYMRQDARFRAGEGITSRYFARQISEAFDWLVTIDPHLHRHRALDEIYAIPATAVSATEPIAQWIATNVPSPAIVGPDGESEQWVEAVARRCGAPFVLFTKTRHGDRSVVLEAPDFSALCGRTPVLVDDMISTGGTLVAAVRQITSAGLPSPVCVTVHALFVGRSFQDLQFAGAARIVSCNSVAHPSNAIDITPVAAAAARRFLEAGNDPS